jgi:hypothetical protein
VVVVEIKPGQGGVDLVEVEDEVAPGSERLDEFRLSAAAGNGRASWKKS